MPDRWEALKKSRRRGLVGLAHAQEVNEAVGEEMEQERPRFEALRNSEGPRVVSSFNLFQTPVEIAARMAEALGPIDGLRILEPSAGLGRLYATIRGRARCTLVEQSADCCAELYRQIEGTSDTLRQSDFLGLSSSLGQFDAVLMNPPFKQGRDIKHIMHAYNFLRPGGRLVALCYDGARQNGQLKPIADTWETLPAGSFKSEGTAASVALLTMNKEN